MSPPRRLDSKLLERISKKIGKSQKYTREQISKRGSRLGITSEASQVVWAAELGIGYATVFRNLEPHIQEQVRSTLATSLPTDQRSPDQETVRRSREKRPADPIMIAAQFLINDDELRSRCVHLLRRKTHLDTVIREATVVLEDRIRKLSGVTEKLNPSPLVSRVLNPDTSKAILIVSDEASEQQGIHNMVLGLVLAFRDPAHHALDDSITQRDALKLLAFVDVLLDKIGSARRRV